MTSRKTTVRNINSFVYNSRKRRRENVVNKNNTSAVYSPAVFQDVCNGSGQSVVRKLRHILSLIAGSHRQQTTRTVQLLDLYLFR